MLWLLLPCTWLAIAVLLDRFGHRETHPGPFDALIVPGCAVRPDGTASGALRRRTEHAVALWHNGAAPLIVLTGGIGRFPPSEAHAAAAIAEAAGVPADALVLEAASTTTAENAQLAAEALPDADQLSVLVVTDSYHAWRCRHLFRRHFRIVHATGSTPSGRLRIRGALREVASIGSMFLKSGSNA